MLTWDSITKIGSIDTTEPNTNGCRNLKKMLGVLTFSKAGKGSRSSNEIILHGISAVIDRTCRISLVVHPSWLTEFLSSAVLKHYLDMNNSTWRSTYTILCKEHLAGVTTVVCDATRLFPFSNIFPEALTLSICQTYKRKTQSPSTHHYSQEHPQ